MKKISACLLFTCVMLFFITTDSHAWGGRGGRRSFNIYRDTRRAVVRAGGQLRKFCTKSGSGFKEFFARAGKMETYEELYEKLNDAFVPKIHNAVSPLFKSHFY